MTNNGNGGFGQDMTPLGWVEDHERASEAGDDRCRGCGGYADTLLGGAGAIATPFRVGNGPCDVQEERTMKSSRSHISLRAVILSLVLLVTGNTAGLAANGPEQELDKILMAISNFAVESCGRYPEDEGRSFRFELSGNAELNLPVA